MNKYVVVFITVSSAKEAEKITKHIIGEKLAACVNIIPEVSSTYWWKNKIENSTESLLIIKTRKTCFKKLIKEVKKIHSYTVPEIIALPIIDGNKDYLKWISDSLKGGETHECNGKMA